MFFKKLNNAELWDKIQKLRELIKIESSFKQRKCWNCCKDLNIYDFLSDNVKFMPEYILKLWQTPFLEFHCCECFRELEKNELEKIEQQLNVRNCSYCNNYIDLKRFTKIHNYLKIYELKQLWFDPNYKVFCENLCRRKYFKNSGSST